MEDNIKAWSYSRYAVYQQCPYKAKLLYIDKHKEPSNEAMDRGSKIHSAIERYLKGEDAELCSSVKCCREFITKLRDKEDIESELSVAINKDLHLVGWFDRDAWLRLKVDAIYKADDTVHIIDFKTGKERESHVEQAEVYSMAGQLLYPGKRVIVTFLYVDSGKDTNYAYSPARVKELFNEWVKRGEYLCSKTSFQKKPSVLCGWCYFNANNAGLCEQR